MGVQQGGHPLHPPGGQHGGGPARLGSGQHRGGRGRQVHSSTTPSLRVANNGDTANKIGTYSLAVLAKHHKLPCTPTSPPQGAVLHRDANVNSRPAVSGWRPHPYRGEAGRGTVPCPAGGGAGEQGARRLVEAAVEAQDQLVAVTRCGILRLTSPPPTSSPVGSVRRGSGPRTTSGCKRLSFLWEMLPIWMF